MFIHVGGFALRLFLDDAHLVLTHLSCRSSIILQNKPQRAARIDQRVCYWAEFAAQIVQTVSLWRRHQLQKISKIISSLDKNECELNQEVFSNPDVGMMTIPSLMREKHILRFQRCRVHLPLFKEVLSTYQQLFSLTLLIFNCITDLTFSV